MIAAHNANDVWTDEETATAEAAVNESGFGSVLVADCAAAVEPIERAMNAARRHSEK